MTNEKPRLVIKSGRVFDSIKGKLLENTTIITKGNKIAWLGDDSSYEKEENDKVIDATGKVVLPGMIETHVHLIATGNPQSEREYLRTKRDMYNYLALDHAQKHLASGFTCVRDCGAYKGVVSSLRRIFDYRVLAGPRLVVSENGLGQWGNQESIGPQPILDSYREESVVTAGVDNVVYAVREQKRLGADFIKTLTTGGVLHGMESKVSFSLWTDDELKAMVDEAHRLGMHLASHAHGNAGIIAAVKAGIDTIEHCSLVDEESAKMMIEKGTYLVSTRSAIVCLANPEIIKQLPPEVQQKIIDVGSQAKDNHKMAFEKGVKFAIGTDAGTPGNFHGNTGHELQFMVEDIGMTPVQALQAATIEGAKAIWLEDKIGSIEKGKLADIVICEKNPLEDITAITDVSSLSHVIKDGIVMAKSGAVTYFSPFQQLTK
ncbi:MAG: amidohydrolase family protein [Candidatus Heimdallarchaeota archaeon]|nr:amidohydrolase family protein [Candidatus Heimdallarchaeota archaeon]MCK4769080.1 amidohydrolase family protein [Candidatus Heimdallarchaeota archaeon]